MSTSNRITLRITGLDKDDGDIKLQDFILELENLKTALTETQKLVSEKQIAYFKIVGLQKNSPAQIDIEAVPIESEHEAEVNSLVSSFFKNLGDINHGVLPRNFTNDAIEAYKNLSFLKDKGRVADLQISRNGEGAMFIDDFSNKLTRIVGDFEYEVGTTTGMLDAINIHNQNVFYVYPVRNKPKLKCIFKTEQRGQALAAVGKYVTVFGQKKIYPSVDKPYPFEMNVFSIEVHPDDDSIPSFSELRGIAPHLTKDKKSEDVVRGIRDEW